MSLAAVIFDFDGVIVDSERIHHATMVEVMQDTGIASAISWEFYGEHLMGLDDRGAFAVLLERAGIAPTPEEIRRRIALKAERFAAVAAAGGVHAFPGAGELIRACAAAGPVGLCSGALRSDIAPVLAALQLESCFAVLVTADDVPASKPDPTCYCLCVQQLAEKFPHDGIAPATCIAIEDTPDGIAAARGAGLTVLGVTTNFPAAVLLAAGATTTIASLAETSPAHLAKILRST